MDQRDEPTWVVLGLTRTGELKAVEGTLPSVLRRDLGVPDDYPVFVPYATNKRKRTSVLTEGYAFVMSGLPETRYFSLENKGCISSVLSSKGPRGIRTLCTIPNKSIVDLKSKLREIGSMDLILGDKVRVISGPYFGLLLEVVHVDGDRVYLCLELKSLSVITCVMRDQVAPPDYDPRESEDEEPAMAEDVSL